MEKNHLEISDRADYLFKSKKKENAFIDIELSFFELNDYCFHLIQSTNKKYKDIDKIYSPEGQAKLEEEFLNDPNFSFEDINEDDEISDQEINNAMMVLEKAKRLKTAKMQREAYSTFMNNL